MPEATSFNALGAGNGFTFCLDKVDVSGFDYWQTLGGFKKTDGGSPSQSQISESLRVAMAIFWNLDGWTGRLYYESGGFSEEITSLSIKNDDWTRGEDQFTATKLTGTGEDDPEFEPKDRVCYRGFHAEKHASGDPIGDGLIDKIELFPSSSFTKNFVRMYDGVTSDEDNFVGYGFNYISATFGAEAFFLEFSSYSNGTPSSPTQTDEDISYVEIPTNITGITIPAVGFIEQYFAYEIPGDFSTYNWETLEFAYDDVLFEAFEFRIDSLDFYTYPA